MLGTTSVGDPVLREHPLEEIGRDDDGRGRPQRLLDGGERASEEPLGVSSSVIEHRANARLVGGSKRGRGEKMPGPAGVRHDVEKRSLAGRRCEVARDRGPVGRKPVRRESAPRTPDGRARWSAPARPPPPPPRAVSEAASSGSPCHPDGGGSGPTRTMRAPAKSNTDSFLHQALVNRTVTGDAFRPGPLLFHETARPNRDPPVRAPGRRERAGPSARDRRRSPPRTGSRSRRPGSAPDAPRRSRRRGASPSPWLREASAASPSR